MLPFRSLTSSSSSSNSQEFAFENQLNFPDTELVLEDLDPLELEVSDICDLERSTGWSWLPSTPFLDKFDGASSSRPLNVEDFLCVSSESLGKNSSFSFADSDPADSEIPCQNEAAIYKARRKKHVRNQM